MADLHSTTALPARAVPFPLALVGQLPDDHPIVAKTGAPGRTWALFPDRTRASQGYVVVAAEPGAPGPHRTYLWTPDGCFRIPRGDCAFVPEFGWRTAPRDDAAVLALIARSGGGAS
jgi:hypothetical protein